MLRCLLATGLAACMAGCADAPREREPGPVVVRLAATLVSPTDIALRWDGADPAAAGRIVEFATEPAGRYTILEFLPPDRREYTHPDLIPQTPFYYRVRPVYGPASRPVEVTLPKGSFDRRAQQDDHEWAYPRTVPGGTNETQPIRNAGEAAAAAPTDLRATVMHANGIKFTWADHARDEEGYLIEVKPAGRADYGVAAVLDPNINSFGLITLPTEKKASFRVRAFYYGKPSNVAHQKTGAEQPSAP